MTALPSGYRYEHVEISGGVVERPYRVPKYVDQCMAFWGWWQRTQIKGTYLGYPREALISRMRRERDGAAYKASWSKNEDFDKLGEEIDLVVAQLGFTMIQICKLHYMYGFGVSAAADETYKTCPYKTTKHGWRADIVRTYLGAQWYLASGLRDHARTLDALNVFYG